MNFNEAEQVRARYWKGGISMESLAREYHVNRSTISRILSEDIHRTPEDKQVRKIGGCEADKDRYLIESGFCKSAETWKPLLSRRLVSGSY